MMEIKESAASSCLFIALKRHKADERAEIKYQP